MNDTVGDHAAATSCENCATPLQGHFCHQCGQSAHNPLHSFGHAVEEVFESFWHLDGRIVRTLRDLLIPGRLISRFLGGHRMPYVPPLRLFVVLSVLTFFVAQFAIHIGNDSNDVDHATPPNTAQPARNDATSFTQDTTVAQVQARRDKLLAELQQQSDQLADLPMARAPIRAGMEAVRASAHARIQQLDPNATSAAPEPATDNASSQTLEQFVQGKGWDPKTHPVHFNLLPGFANHWLNKKLARAQLNLQRYYDDPEEFKHAVIAAIPSALFILVPVFALLLKVFYLGSGRGYLEHLVVGLYSHAFLVLSLLAVFVLMILRNALPASAAWAGGLLSGAQVLLWLWMPVYLWWTQWRVYRQSWWLTSIKYLVIGHLYFMLVGFAALLPVISSFIH